LPLTAPSSSAPTKPAVPPASDVGLPYNWSLEDLCKACKQNSYCTKFYHCSLCHKYPKYPKIQAVSTIFEWMYIYDPWKIEW
jgi:hypothetical protein